MQNLVAVVISRRRREKSFLKSVNGQVLPVPISLFLPLRPYVLSSSSAVIKAGKSLNNKMVVENGQVFSVK
jgi:hypothetical protein